VIQDAKVACEEKSGSWGDWTEELANVETVDNTESIGEKASIFLIKDMKTIGPRYRPKRTNLTHLTMVPGSRRLESTRTTNI
jgi:hypothetical protein